MVKTPVFKLEARGKDMTQDIKTKLLSLSFNDEAGIKSDSLELKVSGSFKRPDFKDELKLWLGYEDEPLFYCGTFKVQNSTLENGQTLNISATGADFSASLKERKNRTFENINVQALCTKIAAEHSLTPRCNLHQILSVAAQTNESDLHFLKRLSRELGAVFSIKNNCLIFKDQKEKKSLPQFELDLKQASRCSIKYSNKTLYKSCEASWHDTKANRAQAVVVGSGQPRLHIKGAYQSAQEAQTKVQAALHRANKGTISGSLSHKGQAIYAGGRLKLIGHAQATGEYSLKSVRHSFDKSGGWNMEVAFEN